MLRPARLLPASFARIGEEQDFFAGSLTKTLNTVFATSKIHSGAGNAYFVASDRPELAFVRQSDLERVHPRLVDRVQATYASAVPQPAAGIVLTDDYNPVEFYHAINREMTQRELAIQFRSL